MSRIIATAAIRGAHACMDRAEPMLAETIDGWGAMPPSASRAPPTRCRSSSRSPAGASRSSADLEEALAEARGWLPAVPDRAALAALPRRRARRRRRHAHRPRGGRGAEAAARHRRSSPASGSGPRPTASCASRASSSSTAACPASPPASARCPTTRPPSSSRATCRSATSSSSWARTPRGETMAAQLHRRGVEMSWETFLVPYGPDTSSLVHALGFACRAAMTFGGLKPGRPRGGARDPALQQAARLRLRARARRGRRREVRDRRRRHQLRLPRHRRHRHPARSCPSGICTYEHVVSNVPHRSMAARAVEVRGVKIHTVDIPIPVRHGPGLRGRARPQGGPGHRVRRQVHARLRVPGQPADGPGRGRPHPRRRPRDRGRAGGGAPAARHLRRGGRPQDAARVRVDPRAPHPLVPLRADGRHAPRAARLGLAAHLEEDARRRLQDRAPGHGARSTS